ncbi:phage head-tail connector protein [Limosilactobacillus oris]|uniref:phage head-tail connector protein n=1 Tax=Limosilactobacillus oris TaxID=1632 RepID=UPI0024B37FF8|nr:phage head-tail connector protein [Limosilactobacillus oris]WHO84902.1 phage head-tail connector protein [Limosilactobacillus oris]
MSDNLSDLKDYIGIPEDNNDFDKVLKLIIKNTEMQLRVKLGLMNDINPVPDELAYIPFSVEVKRYNRLKNEGMTSFTQEGESITFNANDFDEFQSDINDWKKQNGTSVLVAMDPYRKRGDNHVV